MSRSNHQPDPEPRRRQPKLEQPELVDDPEPQTVTVDGAGLTAWSARARTGEVFIYKMVTKIPGIYTLHLMWLHGRQLYTGRLPIRKASLQESFTLFKP